MPAPTPPVPFKDHCSIIHNNVLYVYSADAFQILPLKEGAKWKQETNGVSVAGAQCVYGGIDGDNSQSALYVVGGAANESNSDFPGLQRYSIEDKSWTTITPVVPVTQHRQYHGVAYMNASSGLIIYGGSQDGYTGLSSETFFMEMYPPYRVQAYSSNAPPTIKPFMLPWSDDRAVMVGGSTTNVNVFTFGPADGWQDLGLALPNPLPDPSVAQAALFTLDDGSKILQTFTLGQDPVSISTNVLLNPGGLPAVYGEVVGGSVTTSGPPAATGTSKTKRSTFLNTYPTYDGADMPNTTRTDFSIAQSQTGLVAFVGGDANSTVTFFNQSGNAWVLPEKLLGDQKPLTTSRASSTFTSSTRATSTASASASASHSSAPASHGHDNDHVLTKLGGVLGGICGLAAILIIILLCLRSVRKRKQKEERESRKSHRAGKKTSNDFDFEEGLQPLSRSGQPMGRSPVPSAVVSEVGSTAMFESRPSEKNLIRRVSNDGRKGPPGVQKTNGNTYAQGRFQRERHPMSISKPMNPDLGDYGMRDGPSIDLGRATPAAPVNSSALAAASVAAASATVPKRNKSQRKTDEAWAKYFNGEDVNPTAAYKSHSRGSSRGGGGFWPGSGAPEKSTRSPKLPLRDSVGNILQAGTVAMASPSMATGPSESRTRNLSVVQGRPARISTPGSISSDDDDDEYEDQLLDAAFSSGIPSNIPDQAWSPVGNTWSGPPQRPVRPSFEAVGANDFPPPTTGTSSSGNTSDTKSSSIPHFPMPSSTIRPIQPSGEAPTVSNIQHPAATHFATTWLPTCFFWLSGALRVLFIGTCSGWIIQQRRHVLAQLRYTKGT